VYFRSSFSSSPSSRTLSFESGLFSSSSSLESSFGKSDSRRDPRHLLGPSFRRHFPRIFNVVIRRSRIATTPSRKTVNFRFGSSSPLLARKRHRPDLPLSTSSFWRQSIHNNNSNSQFIVPGLNRITSGSSLASISSRTRAKSNLREEVFLPFLKQLWSCRVKRARAKSSAHSSRQSSFSARQLVERATTASHCQIRCPESSSLGTDSFRHFRVIKLGQPSVGISSSWSPSDAGFLQLLVDARELQIQSKFYTAPPGRGCSSSWISHPHLTLTERKCVCGV
jgi:hypothetical protein